MTGQMQDDVLVAQRDDLVARFVATVDSAGPSLHVVRGSAGMGKSWIIERVLRQLATESEAVVVSFDAGSSVGLAPFEELLTGGGADPIASSPVAPLDVIQHVGPIAQELMRRVGRGDVVVIEDVHWADHEAMLALIELLEFMLRANQGPSIFLTCRDNILGEEDRLHNALGGLAASWVDLDGLGEDEVHGLVRELGYLNIDPQLVAQLHRRSGGNPLYVAEALHYLIEVGLVVAQGTRLEADRPIDADLPAALRDVVGRRVALLGEPSLTLAAVAVLGEPCTVETIAEIAERMVSDVSVEMARSVDARLVRRDSVGLYHVSHELIRQALLASIPSETRSALHARIASDLIDDGKSLVAAALHVIAAGDQVPETLLLTRALDMVTALLAVGAWSPAGELGDRARHVGDNPRLALFTGMAHKRNADQERALAAMDIAVERAIEVGDLEAEVIGRSWRARARAFTTDLDAPRSLVHELLETAERPDVVSEPALATELLAAAAEIQSSAGLPAAARAAAQAAVRMGQGDAPSLAAAHSSAGIVDLGDLRHDMALANFDSARRFALESSNGHLQVVAANRAAFLHLCRGDLDSAEDALDLCVDLVDQHGSWAEKCLAAAAGCSIALARGDLHDLRRRGERARRYVHRSEYYLGPFLVFPTLLGGALAERDSSYAWELLDEWAETGQPGSGVFRLLVRYMEGGDEAVAAELANRPIGRRWRAELNFANAGVLASLLELANGGQVAGDGFDRIAAIAESAIDGSLAIVPTAASSGLIMWGDALAAMGDREGAASVFDEAAINLGGAGAPLGQARALLRRAAALRPGTPERSIAAQSARTIGQRLGAAAIVADATAVLDRDGVSASRAADGSSPVAIVLTDIVGSTAIADRHGDELYTDVIDRHDNVVRRQIKRFGGHEFDHTGDGIYAWFSVAEAAVDCLASIQRELSGYVRGVEVGLRSAAVYGDCYFRRGDPYGSLCNLASRVCELGGAGSILVNDDLLRRLPRERRTARSLPTTALKGIGNPPALHHYIHE